jgi:hypothetical protein
MQSRRWLPSLGLLLVAIAKGGCGMITLSQQGWRQPRRAAD